MKGHFILLVVFLFSTKIHAQTPTFTLKDTAFAHQLLKESTSLNGKGKYTEGYAKADSALIIFEKALGRETKEVANALHQKGNSLFFLGKGLESLTNYEQSLAIRLNILSADDPLLAALYNNIGSIYNSNSEFDKAIDNFQKAFAVNAQIKNGQTLSMSITLANFGKTYFEKGMYEKANDYLFQSLRIRKNLYGDEHTSLPTAYISIGNVYFLKTEFEKAIEYYEKALAIQLKNEGENVRTTGFLNNIGSCYEAMGQLDKAQEYQEKALTIRAGLLPKDDNRIATSYNNIGMILSNKKQLDSAIIYFEKALFIHSKTKSTNPNELTYIYMSLGNTYFLKHDFNKSLAFFEKAQAIYLKIYGNIHPLTAATYSLIGENYAALGFNEIADSCHQKCLIASQYLEKNNFSKVVSFEPIMRSFKNLTLINALQFKKNRDSTYLFQYLDWIKQGIAALDYQNKHIPTEGDKINHIKANYGVYEAALLGLNYFDNDSLRRIAFDYVEKSKNLSFHRQINEINALHFAKIPDSLLQQEVFLRQTITANEKKKLELSKEANNEMNKNVLAISTTLFDLKRDYEALKALFEKQYLDYFQLKYDTQTVNIAHLQKALLSDNQTLIEYFVGDSSIYVFTINRDNYRFKKIDLDFNLDSLVQLMRGGLVGFYTKNRTDSARIAAPINYTEGATQLYNKLILPIKKELKKELIIIPDGILGAIPFEALIREKNEVAYHFNAHKYLIDDHQVSYSYSATLLNDMLTKKHKREPTNFLLGMAPFSTTDTTLMPDLFSLTEGGRAEIMPLKHSGQEVANITKLMHGTSFYGKNATEQKFMELAPNYRIIHLATHSKVNPQSSNYSFLAFSEIKDSIENELLYVRELYNVSLNADMVVLSACETGIGEIQRGEGIISLARAFSYAGAKSIITSLWQVNDQKTKILMIDFYKYLRRGLPKQEALWRAKLDFMRKTSSDPYFWAGFIGIGNMTAIQR
jgi:CHAT domain-containing protein/Tfp pilus assembly protein PilF